MDLLVATLVVLCGVAVATLVVRWQGWRIRPNAANKNHEVQGVYWLPEPVRLPRERWDKAYLDPLQMQFREAIRRIQTDVVLAGREKPWRVLAIVGLDSRASAELLAVNLAHALSQLENTLLIGYQTGAIAAAGQMTAAQGIDRNLVTERFQGDVHGFAQWLAARAAEGWPPNCARLLIAGLSPSDAFASPLDGAIDAWLLACSDPSSVQNHYQQLLGSGLRSLGLVQVPPRA